VHVRTRTFDGSGLLPLIDLLNTGPDSSLNLEPVYDPSVNLVCMQSLRELHAGEELLIDYAAAKEGPLGMFTIYGFALPATYYKDYVLSVDDLGCIAWKSTWPQRARPGRPERGQNLVRGFPESNSWCSGP